MRTPRLLRRLAALGLIVALAFVGAGCTNDDNGGVLDGGGTGTAPLRPGATYGATTTSSVAP